MDLVTLSMANEYTDSQRLGYTETVKKTITWDGNTEGKVSIPFSEDDFMYKVSDIPINITEGNIKRVYNSNDEHVLLDFLSVQTQEAGNGATMTVVYYGFEDDTVQLAMVADGDINIDDVLFIEKGVYFAKGNFPFYISLLETEEEVIHQIDQKFIPKTVINLCDHGINVYEILHNMLNNGLSGVVYTSDCKQPFWDSIPVDGSTISVINDDGVNSPLIFYGVNIGVNKNRGKAGIFSVTTRMIEYSIAQIIDLFLCVDPSLIDADTGEIIESRVTYHISLEEAPTVTTET